MNNKWKSSNLAHKFKIFVAIMMIFCLLMCGFYIGRRNFINYIKQYTSAVIELDFNYNINKKIQSVLRKNEVYGDYDAFVKIEKDKDDAISLINVNMSLANMLLTDLVDTTQIGIKQFCETSSINVPLMAFTGSVFLAQYGSQVQVRLLPVGNVKCNFRSKFESIGINQTIHTLYIDMEATNKMILPLYIDDITIINSIIVVENLIIGKIPDIYYSDDFPKL